MPSKIFEAMGMRRTILIGVDGEARRLVERSGGGLGMSPEDEEALVQNLIELEAHRGKLAEMGENGRSFVLSNFDRDHLATRYLNLLNTQ
jgi:glycosyltransferase involved in cell wall biosynthesis